MKSCSGRRVCPSGSSAAAGEFKRCRTSAALVNTPLPHLQSSPYYYGVAPNPNGHNFDAFARASDGSIIHAGVFRTKEEAAAAHDAIERQQLGPAAAKSNFPSEEAMRVQVNAAITRYEMQEMDCHDI
jgi:hypothetical protein